MALAIDDDTRGEGGGGSSNNNIAHTVASGDDRLLLVFIQIRDTNDANRGVDAVTYNGDALSLIRTDDNVADNLTIHVYYLIAPDVGTANVNVDWGAAYGPNAWAVSILSITGADQTSPIEDNDGTTATNASGVSVTLTTATDGAWVVSSGMAAFPAAADTQPNTGQTVIHEQEFVNGLWWQCLSYEEKATAGNEATGFNETAASTTIDWVMSAVAVKPAGGGGGGGDPIALRTLMGVGV